MPAQQRHRQYDQSRPEVPTIVMYIHRWLLANASAEHRLDKTLLSVTKEHPGDAVVTLLRVSPCCDRIALHLLGLLSSQEPHWDLPALAFLVEVLECLDSSECADSVVKVSSRYLQSECRERRRLALRALLELIDDPSMASRETLLCAVKFMKRRDLKKLVKEEKLWKFSKCLGGGELAPPPEPEPRAPPQPAPQEVPVPAAPPAAPPQPGPDPSPPAEFVGVPVAEAPPPAASPELLGDALDSNRQELATALPLPKQSETTVQAAPVGAGPAPLPPPAAVPPPPVSAPPALLSAPAMQLPFLKRRDLERLVKNQKPWKFTKCLRHPGPAPSSPAWPRHCCRPLAAVPWGGRVQQGPG
ncbi:uncharacterized protein LOC132334558 [Haemorhous mexicanus]|uniref:uncharacterized protein LOC132334558 n=1 Tax=Haemorhous mexicanus TaxID=30427 RepID=UPI0028BF400D|nr:uncharacterized protein LOC132334558 [Haemorhous mexicanus]